MNTLYLLGLILALLYILMGFDDFIWDIIALFYKKNRKDVFLNMQEINATPYKLLAVIIGAWREDNVIEDVIDNFLASTIYPKSMYHIFIGVYPNDNATIEAATRLETRYPNVHMIINEKDGPTSKAQNINHVLKQIRQFEIDQSWDFSSYTIHDAEDVVHPYELKITNTLVTRYPALQFPVFPLIMKPNFKNFFPNITSSSYADEFAENHLLTMVNRDVLGAFVPSAGTGFVLTKTVLDAFPDGNILPSDSLTEDYRLSLTLYEKKIPMHYVMDKIKRVTDEYTIKFDYISTRSMFPNTFDTAVRQKTRWITGITMQSMTIRDIFKSKLPLMGRYSLYKDQKAKIGNLLAFIGYPVFIYFIASLFIDLPIIYPAYSLSWYLSLIVTIFMIERQVFRAISIYRIYGLRSVFFAVFFPPLLPFRIIWGNIINFTATVRSFKAYYFGTSHKKVKQKNKTSKPMKWDKTEHTFLSKEILKRYHRRLGDVLIEKDLIQPKQIIEALKDIKRNKLNQSLGRYLLEKKWIEEYPLVQAIAEIKQSIAIKHIDLDVLNTSDLIQNYDYDELMKLNILPLIETTERILFATVGGSAQIDLEAFADKQSKPIEFIYTTYQVLDKAFEDLKTHRNASNPYIDAALKQGILLDEQVLIAMNRARINEISIEEAFALIGIHSLKGKL